MRISIMTSLLILLTSCASTNYYEPMVTRWQGSSDKDLITRLGQPNQIIQSADGSQTWIYMTKQPLYSDHFDYQTQTFVAGGKTFGVLVPRNQPKTMMIGCTSVFTLNKQDRITHVQFEGSHCYGKGR